MFLAFPKLLAVAFSGFYLPLMIVLWLLIFRALGIELRHQLDDGLWVQFWDVAFAGASVLLAIFFGVALGNVVRGVPLREDGTFFEPLWTNFQVMQGAGQGTGIVDWFTLLVGLSAGLALAHHGALWLLARTDEAVAERARNMAEKLWPYVCASAGGTGLASLIVQPQVSENLPARPWSVACIGFAVAGLVASRSFRRTGRGLWAFLASGLYLYAMLATVAVALYPYVLPARTPGRGLTVHAVAAGEIGLASGLMWWVPGMLLACGYFVYVYRSMPATFSVHDQDGH